MPSLQKITSAQNPQLKAAIRLRESRQRRKQRLFLIDGLKEISRAMRSGIELERVFVCETTDRATPAFNQLPSDLPGFEIPETLFDKIAFGSRKEPVAIARTPDLQLSDIPSNSGALIAVIEQIEKPGNVGAVIRSACGAGCDGVIVADPATDLFNPNTIRASLGSLFSIPVCACSSEAAIFWLSEHDFQIVTSRVDASSSYLDIDYRNSTAIVMGSESRGLSELWSTTEMQPVQIPMSGDVDSLNISVSAAILLYEAMRQRSKS